MVPISDDVQLSISFVSWINEQLREEKQRREEEQTPRRRWIWSTTIADLTTAIVSVTFAVLWLLDR